jgi:hypothetical protein
LPGGESCSDVIVLAVRFQNRVSFADAPAGTNAKKRAVKVAALVMSRCSVKIGHPPNVSIADAGELECGGSHRIGVLLSIREGSSNCRRG